jgi:hypothetical protein
MTTSLPSYRVAMPNDIDILLRLMHSLQQDDGPFPFAKMRFARACASCSEAHLQGVPS